MAVSSSPYALDNDYRTASPMLDCLSEILDPFTRGRLTDAGVPEAGRCWEIGAGNGSVAAWLAQQVGPEGTVYASDIKPQHVVDHPGVQVYRHDIAGDDPLPGPFGVIHARLLLAHLPTRWEIVAALAGLLAPGGALVVEEWGQWTGSLLCSPRPDAALVYARYQSALLEVFRGQGNDTSWAVKAADAMAAAGLVEVDVAAGARSWAGGSAGCRLPVLVSAELRQVLLAAGLSTEELHELVQIMEDPHTLILGNSTISTIGRRRA